MIKFRRLLALAIPLAAFSLVSCDSKDYTIETINYQADGEGWLQFKTNDDDLMSKAFVHAPAVDDNSFANDSSWTATIQVKKLEGSIYSPFGLMFDYVDSDNYLALILRISGDYKIIQKLDGGYTKISEWSSASAIKGWEKTNTISLSFTPPGDASNPTSYGYFQMSVNDTQLSSDSGSNPTRLTLTAAAPTTSKIGFFVGTLDSDYESFPKYPSDQRFKVTVPFVYP
jgi:hypothetical protein